MQARALLAICRVSNLPTVWMNVVSAVVLASPAEFGYAPPLLCLSMSAFYCGGMALNDLLDRHVDARHQPFRPIPAGRVTVGEARVLTGALFVTALLPLLLVPHPGALGWGFALLALIVTYDHFHKQIAAMVVVMAATRFLVFVTSAWAVAGTVAPAVVAAATVQLLYTLLVSLVARHENTRGRRFGAPVIPWMIAGMALLDGTVLALLVAPSWLAAGAAAALLTRVGQRYVRGD
jgi:4-hydroxybenzoate polyprenyltransferase